MTVAVPTSEQAMRQEIGRRVRASRGWLGLSQAEVADKAGTTHNFISAIERGAQGLAA